MMKIEHVAIWVNDLETMRSFYETYFGGKANEKYHNPITHFQSYFIRFDSGCRLELMHRPDVENMHREYDRQKTGLVHLAFSVGSQAKVDGLTNDIRNAGYRVVGEPRTTGDGYYESVILDPENNIIEITE